MWTGFVPDNSVNKNADGSLACIYGVTDGTNQQLFKEPAVASLDALIIIIQNTVDNFNKKDEQKAETVNTAVIAGTLDDLISLRDASNAPPVDPAEQARIGMAQKITTYRIALACEAWGIPYSTTSADAQAAIVKNFDITLANMLVGVQVG